MLKDALKNALGPASKGLEAREPEAAPPSPLDALPDPAGSPWVQALARHVTVPKGASVGKLSSLTGQAAKQLKARGAGRDAKSLKKAEADFLGRRSKAAWAAVKRRWKELELSDKAYRSIKQRGADPEKLLAKLHTRKAEAMRGASSASLATWLK
jgi:hypothetical protein